MTLKKWPWMKTNIDTIDMNNELIIFLIYIGIC